MIDDKQVKVTEWPPEFRQNLQELKYAIDVAEGCLSMPCVTDTTWDCDKQIEAALLAGHKPFQLGNFVVIRRVQ